PQIKRVGFRVTQNTDRAPPFRFGGARACFSHRIAKDPPHYPDILSLRQDCPSLVSVSGTCSLFDGMCTIATGSFLAEPTRSSHLLTAFPPGIQCALLFSSIHCYLDPSSGAAL